VLLTRLVYNWHGSCILLCVLVLKRGALEHNVTVRDLLTGALMHGDCSRQVRVGLLTMALVPEYFMYHGSLIHIAFVNQGCHMRLQDSRPPLNLSHVAAANNLVSCIMYEVMQEALHEVCVLHPLVTQAMPFSRSRHHACYIPQLPTMT
jgi:hypothetical protein